jgi:hypothetical protein
MNSKKIYIKAFDNSTQNLTMQKMWQGFEIPVAVSYLINRVVCGYNNRQYENENI